MLTDEQNVSVTVKVCLHGNAVWHHVISLKLRRTCQGCLTKVSPPFLVVHYVGIVKPRKVWNPRSGQHKLCCDEYMCRWDLSDNSLLSNQQPQMTHSTLSTANFIRRNRITSFRWTLAHRRGVKSIVREWERKRSQVGTAIFLPDPTAVGGAFTRLQTRCSFALMWLSRFTGRKISSKPLTNQCNRCLESAWIVRCVRTTLYLIRIFVTAMC